MPQIDQHKEAVTLSDVDEDEFPIVLDISHIETEDDTPVDNLPSEKGQRLLTEPLYSSWDGGNRKFLVCANVGLFSALYESPIVPDVLLSMDVQVAPDWYEKEHRSYFVWEFGKLPEVAIEIVSNRKGGEAGDKMHIYSRIGIDHYVIFDPMQIIGDDKLRVYERRNQRYYSTASAWFEGVGLGVCLWDGEFEGVFATWLRWCDKAKNVIPTGAERALLAQQQAQLAQQQAQLAQQQAEQESALRQQAEQEIARLRAELEALRAEKPISRKGKKS